MRSYTGIGLLILYGCTVEPKPNLDTSDSDTDTAETTNTETDSETDTPTDTNTETGIPPIDSASDSGADTEEEPATVTIIDASTYETVMDAIDAANFGDTVYLPSATYIIDATFELKTGVNLLGDKQDRAILKTVDGSALKITQNRVNNVAVSHLHFENIHFLFSEQSDFYNKITNLTFRHCLFDKGTLDSDWDDAYFAVVRTKDVVVEYCEFLRNNPDEGGRGVTIYLGRNTIVRDSYFGTTRDLTQAYEHGYFKTAINVNGHVVSTQVYRSEDIRLHGNTLRRHDDPNIPYEYQDHMIYAWGYDGLTMTHNKGEGWGTTADGGLKVRNGDRVIAYRNRLRDSGFLTYSYDNGSHTYPEHFIDAVLMGNRIDLHESTEECTSNYCGIIYWRNFGDRCDPGLEDNISIMDNYFVDGGFIRVSSADSDGFCSSGNIGNESDDMNNVCNTIQTSGCQPDSWTHYPTGVYAGDFNGDGTEDFVLWQDNTWQMHESDGHGFTVSNWGNDLNPSYETFRHDVHVLDVNGDGYDDLVYRGLCAGNTACFRVHVSDGSTFSSGLNWGSTASFSSSPETFNYGITVGDFNGDGNEDLLYRGSDSNSNQWIVQRSTGTGFVSEVWNDAFWESEQTRTFGVVVGNFDGDSTGRDDIAYRGECSGAPCFVVHTSTGTTFSEPNDWGNNYYGAEYTEHLSLFVGDYNNDGKDDLGYRGKCGTGDHKWRFHKSDGQTFTVNNCSHYNKFDEFNDPN